MKLLEIIFVLVMYSLVKGMITGDAATGVSFPTFTAPTLTFRTIPGSCSGFTDCIEYVGNIIVNMVLGIVYAVLLIYELVRYIVLIIAFVVTNMFAGVSGAPAWLNALLVLPYAGGAGVIIYKLFRKGDDTA